MPLIEDSLPKQLCNLHGFGDQQRNCTKTTLQHGQNWLAASSDDLSRRKEGSNDDDHLHCCSTFILNHLELFFL